MRRAIWRLRQCLVPCAMSRCVACVACYHARPMPESVIILACLIVLAATLYSSVGHAGASGYLAAMALVGVSPATMKPTALMLNIMVASIATLQFYRAGCFSWRLLWPFAIASIPAAFVGGAIALPEYIYKPIVGCVLLFAAARMFMTAARQDKSAPHPLPFPHPPPLWAALLAGALIGLLSGLTGTGGGIFLSPLLILAHWAKTRETSGVSAAFILVNSISGILGAASTSHHLHAQWWILAAAAVTGGLVGSTLGARTISTHWLRRLLAVVLIVAGLKMLFA
jgi:uncharacterized membrane protein YfcA